MSSKEVWKEIVEFPNYVVSNFGRVKNTKTGRILKQSINDRGKGYLWVTLYNNGHKATKAVHRLVGLIFLGKTPSGLEINHVDGVKIHNAVGNFEFVTRSKNIKHAYDLELAKRSITAGSKCKVVRNIDTNKVFTSISEAARSVGASQWHVSQVIKGRGKTAKGYRWELVD